MDYELFEYIAAVLAAVRGLEKIFSSLVGEVSRIQSRLSRMRDEQRRQRELATIRKICEANVLQPAKLEHPPVWQCRTRGSHCRSRGANLRAETGTGS
jgi:hypothetical protein